MEAVERAMKPESGGGVVGECEHLCCADRAPVKVIARYREHVAATTKWLSLALPVQTPLRSSRRWV
jgi:hypothetical protein